MHLFHISKHLVNNRAKQALFVHETGFNIPEWPVVTRWGTWLEFSSWLFDNFNAVHHFIQCLVKQFSHEKDSEILKMIEGAEFESEIRQVYSFSFIAKVIYQLESETLSTENQIRLLKLVISKLSSDTKLSKRLSKIISRNPDLKFFLDFNQLKCPEKEKVFSYVPLTTVEVERSFSKYREILSDKRRNLTVENMEKYLFIYFNNFNK